MNKPQTSVGQRRASSLHILFGLAFAGLSAGCDLLSSHHDTASVPGQSNPVFVSDDSVAVAEGSTAGIYTAAADDADGDALSYSISGGPDAGMFGIDAQSGVLSFTIAPDFENPDDSDGDNAYIVDLEVEDGRSGRDTMTLSVFVADANDVPVFTSGSGSTTPENANFRYIATAFDADQDALTFSIAGGPDQNIFTMDGATGFLEFSSPPDFDAPQDADADNRYEVDIMVDDGNGGTAQRTVAILVTDLSELELVVGFPTPSANIGGLQSTRINGTVDDLEDGVVDADDLVAVEVNGAPAATGTGSPVTWTHDTAIQAPSDQFTLRAIPQDGLGSLASLALQNDAVVIRPDLLALDGNDDRLLIADSAGLGALTQSDLGSGIKTRLFGGTDGVGPSILFPEAAVLDGAGDEIFIVDSILRAVIALDVASGDRTMISDDANGSGPSFDNPIAIALDLGNDRLLVADAGLEALLSVSLTTGDRTIISDASNGAGPPLLFPTTIALQPGTGLALVAEPFAEAIIGVDLATGDRTVVADAASGTTLDFPIAATLDAAGAILYVADFNLQALIAVDLGSGASTTISDAATGAGPVFQFIRALAVDEIRNRAFVTDLGLNDVFAIDLASGDRTPYAQTRTGSGPSLSLAKGAALTSTTDRILVSVVDGGTGRMLWVGMQDGARTVLADDLTGAGPQLGAISGPVIDEANNRAVVADDTLDAVVSVDLSDGGRSIVSGAGVGAGIAMTEPVAVALDAGAGQGWVIDRGNNAVLSVDLSNGTRTLLSGAGVGLGPDFLSPEAIAHDAGRLFVVDSSLEALVEIDTLTGNRTVVADAATGSGPPVVGPRTLSIDTANGRAIVADGALLTTIFAIDLATGDRTVLTSSAAPGPDIVNVRAAHADSSLGRLFVIDADAGSVMVVDEQTGQRAVVSR